MLFVDRCDVLSICCCVGLFTYSNGFFFQAEDGIRDLVRSRGLGDVYKRQVGIGGIALHQLGYFARAGVVAVGAGHLFAAQTLSLIHI